MAHPYADKAKSGQEMARCRYGDGGAVDPMSQRSQQDDSTLGSGLQSQQPPDTKGDK